MFDRNQELCRKLRYKMFRLPQHLPGYLPVCRRFRSRSIAIVTYHGVVQKPMRVFDWCQLHVANFEEQITFLTKEYTILPLSEVLNRFASGKALPHRTAVLTFDDGFQNVYTTAYPILARYQLPFTIFLVTGLVGARQSPWPHQLFNALMETTKEKVIYGMESWPLSTPSERAKAYAELVLRLKALDYENKEKALNNILRDLCIPSEIIAPELALLSWEEILSLSRTGLVSFGSHTHTHQILSRCTPEKQYEELSVSRDILRERLGKAELFAYPNGQLGDFTDVTKKLLVRLGYRCAVTTILGLTKAGSDLYELRRVNIGADMTFRQFQCRMLGW